MYYFIIPSPESKTTIAIVPCYKKEDGQWVYKKSVNNALVDVPVSEKAQLLSIPDLDELSLLKNATQIGIAGVIAYSINGNVFETVGVISFP